MHGSVQEARKWNARKDETHKMSKPISDLLANWLLWLDVKVTTAVP